MFRSTTRLVSLLLLLLPVSNIEFIYQTVKEEEDVVLSCGKVPPQTQCESTDWIYRKDFRTFTDLFRRGQTTGEGAGTLLSNCSLHLPRVTKDQRGSYKCKQNEKETSHIVLYVASLSQRVENDTVTFTCSVTSPRGCAHDLKWFNNNKLVTTDHKDLKISQSDSGCDLSVSFNDPSPPSEFYQTLKCQVKQNHPTKTFIFAPQPPDEKTTEGTSPPPDSLLSAVTHPDHRRDTHRGLFLRHVLLSVALVTLVIGVTTLLIWTRVKERHETQQRLPVNRQGSVVYENVGEPSVSIRLDPQNSDF